MNIPQLNINDLVSRYIQENQAPQEDAFAYLERNQWTPDLDVSQKINLWLEDDGKMVPVTGREGIGFIYGPPGSRKSSLVRGITASAFSEATVAGFKMDLEEGHLCYMDTEQTEYEHDLHNRAIFNYLGGDRTKLERYRSYMLRDAGSPERRKEIIEEYIQKEKPSVIIVDLITKLIAERNDEAAASRLIDWMKQLSKTCNTLIIGVMHTTFGLEKAKGHMGSLAQEEGSMAMHIERDPDNPRKLSRFKFHKLRGHIEPEPITFGINGNMPTLQYKTSVDELRELKWKEDISSL